MITNTLTLNLDTVYLTDEQFYQLCRNNRDLKFEKTANHKLVVMSPTGGVTGNRNFKLIQQLANWSDTDGTGIGFDSSTCFHLPNGAFYSPDAAWIRLVRWNSLTWEQQQKFPPICPDFIIELRSPSDGLKPQQEKMTEYISNGTSLGWLIDPQNQQVEIYRPGREKEVLESPLILSGEDVLSNFLLNIQYIWLYRRSQE